MVAGLITGTPRRAQGIPAECSFLGIQILGLQGLWAQSPAWHALACNIHRNCTHGSAAALEACHVHCSTWCPVKNKQHAGGWEPAAVTGGDKDQGRTGIVTAGMARQASQPTNTTFHTVPVSKCTARPPAARYAPCAAGRTACMYPHSKQEDRPPSLQAACTPGGVLENRLPCCTHLASLPAVAAQLQLHPLGTWPGGVRERGLGSRRRFRVQRCTPPRCDPSGKPGSSRQSWT
jgi:hypothetical protein